MQWWEHKIAKAMPNKWKEIKDRSSTKVTTQSLLTCLLVCQMPFTCILCTPRRIYRLTYRLIVNWCIGRYIDRHSTNMSTDIYTDTLLIYQLRYVGRHISRYTGIGRLLPGTRTDMSVDMSTENGCLIVGRHVDREATDISPILHWYFSLATGDCTLCKPM